MQSYKDRRPPWIRFQKTWLDDFKFQKMSAESRALLPMLWLMASEDEDPVSGLLRIGYEEISFRLRMDGKIVKESINEIIRAGFLERVEDENMTLFDDTSTSYETVTDALRNCHPEAEAETEAYSKKKGFKKNKDLFPFAFSGEGFDGVVIKLDGDAFNLWFQEYSFNGDEDKFRAIIKKRDDWYSIQPYKTHKNWLDDTTKWLLKNKKGKTP